MSTKEQSNKLNLSDLDSMNELEQERVSRILVIDSDELMSIFIQDALEDDGYAISTVQSAEDGIAILEKDSSYDLLLVDIALSGMSGIDFIRYLAKHDMMKRCIVMCSDNEGSQTARALKAGASGHINKPLNRNLLRQIVAAQLEISKECREYELIKLKLHSLKMSGFMGTEMANEMRKLMDIKWEQGESGMSFHSHYEPSTRLGGDFIDYYTLPDGRIAAVIGDASGEGLQACVNALMCKTIIHSSLDNGKEPAEILEEMNKLLHSSKAWKSYASMIIVVVDPEEKSLVFANAGHDKPFILKHDKALELQEADMMLGTFPDSTFKNHKLRFDPGDRLFLYSDGLITTTNGRGDRFGWERLSRILDWYKVLDSQPLMTKIFEKTDLFKAGYQDTNSQDDQSILIIDLQEKEKEVYEEITLMLPAIQESLAMSEEVISFSAKRFEINDNTIAEITAASAEVLKNSISLLSASENINYINLLIKTNPEGMIIQIGHINTIFSNLNNDGKTNKPVGATFSKADSDDAEALYLDSKLVDSIEVIDDPSNGTIVILKKAFTRDEMR